MRYFIPLIVAGGLLFGQLSGCTAIGYGIGSAIDKHNRAYKKQPLCAATTVKDGNRIRVTTDHDAVYEGKFGGIVPANENEYALRYYAAQRENLPENTIWPILGDSAVFHLGSGDDIQGPFAGYGLHFGEFCRLTGAEDTEVENQNCCGQFSYGMIGLPGDLLPARVFLKDIEWIEVRNDDTLGGKVLDDLVQAGLLPLRSTVVIKQGVQKEGVPIEQIARFESMETGKARWIGFGIGVTIDAGIIGLAIGLAVALSDSGGFGLH